MEQVWGFYVGTGFYVYEQLWSCELTECISGSSFFSVSFVINEKKHCDEKPFHLLWIP